MCSNKLMGEELSSLLVVYQATNKNYWTLNVSFLLTIKEYSPPLGIQQKA